MTPRQQIQALLSILCLQIKAIHDNQVFQVLPNNFYLLEIDLRCYLQLEVDRAALFYSTRHRVILNLFHLSNRLIHFHPNLLLFCPLTLHTPLLPHRPITVLKINNEHLRIGQRRVDHPLP